VSPSSPDIGWLQEQGVRLQESRRGWRVFYLGRLADQEQQNTPTSRVTTWQLPRSPDGWRFELTAQEQGGCGTPVKTATVVCLEKGERISPFQVTREGNHLQRLVFSHSGPLVTVTATVSRDEEPAIEIWKHDLIVEDRTVRLISTAQTLSSNLQGLAEPITAAIARAWCSGCLQPHYTRQQSTISAVRRR